MGPPWRPVVVLGLALAAGCAPPAAPPAPGGALAVVYVASAGDATLTRLDAASGRVVGPPLPAGPWPWRVAPGPGDAAGATSLLVLSSTLDRVGELTMTHVYRSGAGWTTRPVAVGARARAAWLAGDGGRYGVVAYHDPPGDPAGSPPRCRLALVEHRSGTVARQHPVCAGDEFVTGLALEDDSAGVIAYLGIFALMPPLEGAGAAWRPAGRIIAVDAQSGAVVATLPLAGEPRELVLAAAPGRDGRRLYAVEAAPAAWAEDRTDAPGRLLGLDPATLAIESEQSLSPPPTNLAVASDGDHAYALTGNRLTHLDLATGAQRLLAPLPHAATSLAVTDTRVYAANVSRGEVWAVARTAGHLVQTIPVGRHPVHLAVAGAG
jgi:hypothetical protein